MFCCISKKNTEKQNAILKTVNIHWIHNTHFQKRWTLLLFKGYFWRCYNESNSQTQRCTVASFALHHHLLPLQRQFYKVWKSLYTIPWSPLMIEVISTDLTGACSVFLASALSSLDPVSGDVLVWKGGFDKRRNLQFLGEYFSSFSLSVLFCVNEKIKNSLIWAYILTQKIVKPCLQLPSTSNLKRQAFLFVAKPRHTFLRRMLRYLYQRQELCQCYQNRKANTTSALAATALQDARLGSDQYGRARLWHPALSQGTRSSRTRLRFRRCHSAGGEEEEHWHLQRKSYLVSYCPKDIS